MDPISFAKTIYLGDCGIIAIFLDTSKNIVKLTPVLTIFKMA